MESLTAALTVRLDANGLEESLDVSAPTHEHDMLPSHLAQVRRSALVELAAALALEHDAHTPTSLEVRAHAASILRTGTIPLSRGEREHLLDCLVDDVLGLGPLEPLLADASVSEVMVNSHDDVWVERSGQLEKTNVQFDDEPHLRRVIDRIVGSIGRRVDESSPMVDARLADGSRVNVVVPPLALRGSYLTIRRFSDMPVTVAQLVEGGTLTQGAADFLELAVRGGANVLISGGTGTGKTTTLNLLSSAIPDDERIVTIEDAAELRLAQRHVLPMESRPANLEGAGQVTIRDLVCNCLRMRPDRIIVGECRGAEAVDMLQAMNTGHDGCMTTVHANSPRDAIARLETLVLTSGIELPSRAIREQIESAFDLIVQLERSIDGRRRIVAISAVSGIEQGTVLLDEIFVAKPRVSTDPRKAGRRGVLRPTGVRPTCEQKLARRGVQIPARLLEG